MKNNSQTPKNIKENGKEIIKLIITILVSLVALYGVILLGIWLVNIHAIKNNTTIEDTIKNIRDAENTPIREYPTNNGRYKYIVDTSTGVVYLRYNSSGITVMYNADGTIVTADQLGLK